MNPRKYQQDARHQCNALLNAGRHPVNVSPCRTGKTVTAAFITFDRVKLGQHVFVLTPTEEIFNQWRITLSDVKIDSGYINSSGVQGRGKMVYVCMPMSLNNLLSQLPEKFSPDIIITDECHHSMADTWMNIYNFYPRAGRLGLTATPQRTDGKGLDNIYTDIVQTITMQEAIDNGQIAEPLIIVPEQYVGNIPINNGDYDVETQAELLGTTRIIGDVIKQYSNILAGLPVLVACSTHEHAKKMTEAFCDVGWNFEHIHGNLHYRERARMIRHIRSGSINGLCTVGIGSEGLDIDGLYGLIWLCRTKSITKFIQFSSRPLNKIEGKKYGIIIDPVGNTFIHGLPQLNRTWKLTGRTEAGQQEDAAPKMKICPACSVMNAELNVTCHICGYDFTGERPAGKGRKLPVMVDGKMVILGADELAERKEEIRESLKAQRENNFTKNENRDTIPLSRLEKMNVLKNGLERRDGFFADAVKNYL
jgi:superfamily II DNA or RNA helicase